MMRLPVCKVSDVAPGQTRAFEVPGLEKPVLVSNIDGRFAVTSSLCPHEDVSLIGGKRIGTRIACPGHGYLFDLQTGRCSHDPQLTLRRFEVHVLAWTVHIRLLG